MGRGWARLRGMVADFSITDAAELYRIDDWGAPYFSISPEGEVEVALKRGEETIKVSLCQIVDGVKDRGIALPVMLRFGDILDSRISLLNESFQTAIREAGYQGDYRGVYPIKVNQQQQVVEEVSRFGARYHHGFEAGSKPELMAALAYMHDPEAVIVCNGYKDAEFVDLALHGQRMGLQTVLVVEMPAELPTILERAKVLGVRPVLGVRVRLTTPGSGHWNGSAGDGSVFGLTASQIITLVDTLRDADMLDCLKMVHFHIGSQIPDILTVRSGVSEAVRVYTNLVKEGAPLGLLNVGGGLAVDYEGTQTASTASRNYSIEEYCADVVEVVSNITNEAKVPHPTLISESGRATVAHYAVLVFNILDVGRLESDIPAVEELVDVHYLTRDLREVYDLLKPDNLQECRHDADYYRSQLRSLFQHGAVSLRELSLCERIHNATIRRIADAIEEMEEVPDELQELGASIADVYYGNFSLFQSLPDSWAIDQIFPIMPIQRLNEEPKRRGVFSDITCDCDGKLDRFINAQEAHRVLPLHNLAEGEDYNVGVFLVGAYQETLGDLHNLFGDTNVVGVGLHDDGTVEYSHEVEGDTVADVLSYVEFDTKDMMARFRRLAEKAVRKGRITAAERRHILDTFDAGLRGYTYYET